MFAVQHFSHVRTEIKINYRGSFLYNMHQNFLRVYKLLNINSALFLLSLLCLVAVSIIAIYTFSKLKSIFSDPRFPTSFEFSELFLSGGRGGYEAVCEPQDGSVPAVVTDPRVRHRNGVLSGHLAVDQSGH